MHESGLHQGESRRFYEESQDNPFRGPIRPAEIWVR